MRALWVMLGVAALVGAWLMFGRRQGGVFGREFGQAPPAPGPKAAKKAPPKKAPKKKKGLLGLGKKLLRSPASKALAVAAGTAAGGPVGGVAAGAAVSTV